MTLGEFIAAAIERLRAAGIDNPQLDARLLVGYALGMDRAALLSQSQRLLRIHEIQSVEPLINRRATHESVARIIGSREFWGLPFGLNEATLEPRPDSETLVEAVLKLAPARDNAHRILDLGTGTGCLLLSLLHEYPNASGLGIDIAPRAVEQATANAITLGLDYRASFYNGDWLNGIGETFDIIISNPPYIPSADIPDLMQDVQGYDPMLALDGGADGLTPYRLLIPQLARFLNPHGLVAFEVGQGQAQQVAGLFRHNPFENIRIYNDLGNIERCVSAMKLFQ